jgi:hypothetical protein
MGCVAGEVDRDSADLAALGSLRNIDRNLRLRQRLSGLHQKKRTRVRKLHLPPTSLQQSSSEFVFEIFDLNAERWLGNS